MYGLCSHRLSSTNAMISQWVGRRKKTKISTSNFRLFITPMDLIGLRCLYTLSLIKLITRNPPLTIVLSVHSLSNTHPSPHSHSIRRTTSAMAHSLGRSHTQREIFDCESVCVCVCSCGWGAIQHINVMQRFCTLARSNRMKFIFRMCVCVRKCWCIFV